LRVDPRVLQRDKVRRAPVRSRSRPRRMLAFVGEAPGTTLRAGARSAANLRPARQGRLARRLRTRGLRRAEGQPPHRLRSRSSLQTRSTQCIRSDHVLGSRHRDGLSAKSASITTSGRGRWICRLRAAGMSSTLGFPHGAWASSRVGRRAARHHRSTSRLPHLAGRWRSLVSRRDESAPTRCVVGRFEKEGVMRISAGAGEMNCREMDSAKVG
jgi:hypothetical protein